MSKVMLLKIVGVIAVVLVFAGSGIFIWIRHHQDNPVAEKIEKVLPVRVNPLKKESNRVYWFVQHLYHEEHPYILLNPQYQDCYFKGGYIPNEEEKKELVSGCRATALALMKDAKKHGYFKTSKLKDWLDQEFLRQQFIEDKYLSERTKKNSSKSKDKKYAEPTDIHNAAYKLEEEIIKGAK